ncbi:MAG: hypothetical protein LKF15_10930 [Lachnospiraceae bacterium]|nr:hypothetical protein [Eubacterium sp.]MCH4000600.1 hypothetical protein [Lachnospiraceae bacterium]MCH4067301.1 hypothetical protein [Lachnospiraceae bacterium]MCH4113325.1 hypothetical protein [Lachnospiraceae bacterium]
MRKYTDRVKQRENRRKKYQEEKLDRTNICGVKDLTPYHAVNRMIRQAKTKSDNNSQYTTNNDH